MTPHKSPLESFDRPVFTARAIRARKRRRIATLIALLLIVAGVAYYLATQR